MKCTGAAFSSWCASRVSSLPLLSSSPIDSSPTRGARSRAPPARTPRPSPRTAADAAAGTRRVAPRSSSTAGRRRVGIVVASAGRSTPGSRPNARVRRHDRRAGVAGAEQRAPRRRRATASAATRIDARGLRRSAAAGDSAISIDSGASTISTSSAAGVGMPRELGARSRRAIADEQQADLQVPRRDERAVDDAAGAVIAAHRVDGDAHSVQVADRCERTVVTLRRPAGPGGRGSSRSARTRGAAPSARWHCGHAPTGTGFSASCVRRLAVRVFECRRFGLGIVSSPSVGSAGPSSGREPGIFPCRLAVARRAIQVRRRTPGTAPGTRRCTAASSAAPARTARAAARPRSSDPSR